MIQQFKDGFLTLNTRKFNSIIERILTQEFELVREGRKIYDKNKNVVTIKVSRVLEVENKINYNLAEYCLNNSFMKRILSTSELSKRNFNCNIQQIKMKRDNDILFYCLLFSNCVQIFKTDYLSIGSIDNFYYKQHSGNFDECQFHISNNNYNFHLKNLIKTLSYEEIYNILLNMEV